MRQSMTIYLSFVEGVCDLEGDQFKKLMMACFNYGLKDELPTDLNGLEKAVFRAWQANIDASNTRRDNGKKGGRPRKKAAEPTPAPTAAVGTVPPDAAVVGYAVGGAVPPDATVVGYVVGGAVPQDAVVAGDAVVVTADAVGGAVPQAAVADDVVGDADVKDVTVVDDAVVDTDTKDVVVADDGVVDADTKDVTVADTDTVDTVPAAREVAGDADSKGGARSGAAEQGDAMVFDGLEQAFGRRFSPAEQSAARRMAKDYGEELLEHAATKAALANKKTLLYVDGILRSWRKAGIRTVAAAKAERPRHNGSGPSPGGAYIFTPHLESDMEDIYE